MKGGPVKLRVARNYARSKSGQASRPRFDGTAPKKPIAEPGSRPSPAKLSLEFRAAFSLINGFSCRRLVELTLYWNPLLLSQHLCPVHHVEPISRQTLILSAMSLLRLANVRPTLHLLWLFSRRPFISTPATLSKQLPPRRQILDSEIEENFLKGSGPGGQKINKTSSAVQLKHLPTGIVIKCQETRSRSQNRKIARRILGERVDELELGEQSRTAIKQRESSKKKASAMKKKKRKYKALAAKEGESAVEDTENDEEGTEGDTVGVDGVKTENNG